MSKKHIQTAKWHVELSQWYHYGIETSGNRSKVGLEVISSNLFLSRFFADQVLQDNNSGFKTRPRSPELRWLNTVLAVCEYMSFAKSWQKKGCNSQAETWQVKNILIKDFD